MQLLPWTCLFDHSTHRPSNRITRREYKVWFPQGIISTSTSPTTAILSLLIIATESIDPSFPSYSYLPAWWNCHQAGWSQIASATTGSAKFPQPSGPTKVWTATSFLVELWPWSSLILTKRSRWMGKSISSCYWYCQSWGHSQSLISRGSCSNARMHLSDCAEGKGFHYPTQSWPVGWTQRVRIWFKNLGS